MEDVATVEDDGVTTMFVGVTDDAIEDKSDVSRVNVGNGWEEMASELVISADGEFTAEDEADPRLEV